MTTLTFKGGGLMGVISLTLLRKHEYSIPTPNAYYGTSTGSIIAAGLAIGISASDLLSLYFEHGHDIFKPRPFYKVLTGARYDKRRLEKVVDKYFGSITLGEIKPRLIINAVDMANGSKNIAFDSTKYEYKDILLRDVIIGSCAAPTYFNAHECNRMLLIDGALSGKNDPVAQAVMDMNDGVVHSFGTGRFNSKYNRKRVVISSLPFYAKNAFGLLLEQTGESSLKEAQENQKGINVIRYDIDVPGEINDFDNPRLMHKWYELAK